MDALKTIARKPDIRLSKPKEFVVQRIAESAQGWNRAGQMAARVELANEALCHLVELLYQQDTDGALANIDRVTYRIRCPAPWGASGWRVWGLRAWEAEILRKILRFRQEQWQKGQRPPLFNFDERAKTWHLNLADYPALKAAAWWLQKSAITLKEWREYADSYNDASRERYNARIMRTIR